MLKISLQFFAHKKGVGSTKNGRDSESKRTARPYPQAISLSASAARRSIRASMLAGVLTIPCLPR